MAEPPKITFAPEVLAQLDPGAYERLALANAELQAVQDQLNEQMATWLRAAMVAEEKAMRDNLAQLVALEPPAAGRIHLHLPDYQPGRKARTQDNAPLCGVFVPRDLAQVPLDVARLWTHVRPTWAGSEMQGERYWCPPCLGRLVALMRLEDQLVASAWAMVTLARANNDTATLDTPSEHG